jgi:GNAT superfamily N-acetyltransferase
VSFGTLGHVDDAPAEGRAITDPGLYASNTAVMWASMAPWSRPAAGTPAGLSIIHLPARSATRVILRRAFTADPGDLGPLLQRRERVVVEDSFGELSLQADGGVTITRMPVMVKAPGSVTAPAPRSGIPIVEATTRDTLTHAERVIVDGFPQPALQPYRPGRSIPPLVLTVPGWRTWLAYDGGEPAAACCTFDDGRALGIYWLATLPEHRSRGLGRAVMIAALNHSPGLPAVLVATAAGEPLYTSLGFQPVSTAAWYRNQTG